MVRRLRNFAPRPVLASGVSIHAIITKTICERFNGRDGEVLPAWVAQPNSSDDGCVLDGRLSVFFEGFADFPVMPEGIDDAAHPPPVILVFYQPDDFGSGFYRAIKNRIGIIHGQHHARGGSAD